MSLEFEALKKSYLSDPFPTLETRISQLNKLKHILIAHSDELMNAVSKDLGRSHLETFLAELYFSVDEINYAIKHLAKWMRPVSVSSSFFHFPSKSKINARPKGAVAILSPWNYPIQLSISPLCAAIAAGNTVLLKLSDFSIHSSSLLKTYLDDEFKEDRICVRIESHTSSERFLDDPWNHFFFTGSSKNGKIVYEAMARHLTPVTLELGGSNPCILDHSIPKATAVSRISMGKFFNAGQTCVAPNFVLVPQGDHDDYTELFRSWISNAYTQDPKSSPDFGRMIHQNMVHRLHSMLPQRSICFGLPDDRYFPPTLVPHSHLDDPWVEEELFGPVLSLVPYSDVEEVIQKLKNKAVPLAMYLFSKNQNWLWHVKSQLPAGTLGINDVMKQITNHQLPLGGLGASGFGNYRGYFGFQTFSHLQAEVSRMGRLDPFKTIPPYGSKLKQLRKYLSLK